VTSSRNVRSFIRAALAVGLVIGFAGAAAARARAADYVPGTVIVGYAPGPFPAPAADLANRGGTRAAVTASPAPRTVVMRLPSGLSVTEAIKRLRHDAGVTYAVPDFIAQADGIGWIPNDPGRGHRAGGWEQLQWNFLPGVGINAPQAWANLRADHRAGGRGVTIAVLDTGVAYRNWQQFRRSPDFNRTRFVSPHDFIAHNHYPLDREGHGTFVAGIIAESTNNHIGLTGLAYGASIMPVRVLNRYGAGDAATIADGVRYAVSHHAQVINLSLEFGPDVTAGDIPDLLSAIRYAARRGVVVVAAAGNDYASQVAYPARAPTVISVGATTLDRCLAAYSNIGVRLDLVAPGGGTDKSLGDDPDCHPGRALPPIYSMTFFSSAHPARFGLPGGIYGTSMSTPHVSATAALIIASRILGRHPTPDQILARLEQTAQPLGAGRPNGDYGWGLVDAGAATASPTAGAATASPAAGAAARRRS
jgi:serine protease